jgi:methyl-accepting chemotaxis protein-1 (serine sensor receptor)
VRALAQRTSAAAKDVKSLIDTSVSRIGVGTALVDQAGATMEEIISAVSRVTDIMGEIAAASDEQSKGIEQVGQAMTQMDEVTQQNAALVEQAAAAAQSLDDQAGKLKAAVGTFRLQDSRRANATQSLPLSRRRGLGWSLA